MFDSNMFSERLKKARSEKGFSQAELAEKVGVSTTTISSYEKATGQKIPALDKAQAVAEILDVSIDWLCGMSDIDTGKTSTIEVLKGLANAIDVLSLDVQYDSGNGFCPPAMEISAKNQILMSFLMDLNKIAPVLQDEAVPSYLKAGLKKTIYEKYKEYEISQLIFDPQNPVTNKEDFPF